MTIESSLAYASFTIYQDVERPEFWTTYFGVTPDRAGVKGEPRIMPSGRTAATPWRLGQWSVTSESAVQSDRLEPHLRYLLNLLDLPRADLPALAERTHAKMRFFCYWDNYEGNRVPDIPEDIRKVADAMGVEIEIDEYR
ncbi:hypothetical protein AWB75_07137 [Caballeronia catudaia]|uniref:DUF4279 domain-containing protein n=1 Tax=Caballeronia catudaia TaxID=1777136 RepID=A0A158DTY7_9BURK|nr:DUF4279 domain-containing protein [Caballeronia catudaia]SAK97646.1 hypothetical protein AWB75_07137 [Caballeronia catudaia]